jgi:alkylated DNA repair dioxygenase AlkB
MYVYTFDAPDGSTSTIIHVPRFCTSQEGLFLFGESNFLGAGGTSQQWVPPRLQRWSHMSGLPFNKNWSPNFHRWQHVDYTDELFSLQSKVVERILKNAEIMSFVSKDSIVNINSCLLNLYRDHNDSIHLHQDHIPEFGIDPTIVCVSFGATRSFNLIRACRKQDGQFSTHSKNNTLTFDLECGDLLIMTGSTQRFFAHEIPRSATPCGKRISATFRIHLVK